MWTSVKSYVFEFTEEVSITKLFVNLMERIDHLTGSLMEKEFIQFSGKMYRAKVANGQDFTTLCSLQDDRHSVPEDHKFYLLDGEVVIQAHPCLDTIFDKLDLMYSLRQSYSLQGFSWTSEDGTVLSCAAINSGDESGNILIQTTNDQVGIIDRIFPDMNEQNSMKLCEIEDVQDKDSYTDEEELTFKRYFDIIVKVAKLNLQ